MTFVPVHGHPSQAVPPEFQSQPQHLLEQPAERTQMLLAKVGNGPKVRLVSGRPHSERHVLRHPALDLARRKDPHAIRVDQHLGHHHRVVRWLAPLFVFVHAFNRPQIERVDQVADEIRQVLVGQPVPQTRRQQQLLFGQVGAVGLCH